MTERQKEHYEEIGRDEYQIRFQPVFPEEANGVYYTMAELTEKYGCKIGYSSSILWADHTDRVLVHHTIIDFGRIIGEAIQKLKDPKVKSVTFEVDSPSSFSYMQKELREAYGIWAKYSSKAKAVEFTRRAPIDRSKVEPFILAQMKRHAAWRATNWIEKQYYFFDVRFGNTSQMVRIDNIVALAKKLGLKQIPPFKDYSYATGTAQYVDMSIAEWFATRHKKVPAKTVKLYEKELKAWWKSIKDPVEPK